MRVQCHSLDDFLLCLENEEGVFQDAVRTETYRRPQDGNSRDATKFQVVFQASAIVILDTGAEYLLEFGTECGRDIEDAEPDRAGTAVASELKERLKRYVMTRGWKLLPGTISI